ncbi:DUF4365 domain-containing protein [Paenibacillus sp. WQ 127069]|uniref:DUF4365 domain-containing protein n=1 Tax=Paenibacillus baimaensis TaxID=2982185 RepID=A0ABT2UCP9_9BACL|nr:DUF4365 domain-containing protein [Paenibacillus sp. WQ 127069]MCU6792410.1 DUF4365 domain-containing protein [Paenibacillus sp. WQ 127069]
MPVSIQSIEESLSVSYVSAIVAQSGASFDIVSRDYGVDVCVRRVDSFNGKMMDMGVSFDCQLKATINWDLEDTSIVYDLEADTYNKLIYRHINSSTPCLLVVLCLPRNKSDWMHISEEGLNLRKCCYYYYVNGEATENKSSFRIRIPRTNIFSPDAVVKLINDVRLGVIK